MKNIILIPVRLLRRFVAFACLALIVASLGGAVVGCVAVLCAAAVAAVVPFLLIVAMGTGGIGGYAKNIKDIYNQRKTGTPNA